MCICICICICRRWGWRLPTWPHGSPGVVVHGQLGWPDVDTLRLSQAASLCSRLLSLHIAALGTWHVVPAPNPALGSNPLLLNCRMMVSRTHRTRESTLVVRHRCPSVGCETSNLFCRIVPVLSMLPRAGGQLFAILCKLATAPSNAACRVWPQVATRNARYWGVARCGHHCFHDGRATRHRDSNTALVRCHFCATGVDSLEHALLHFSAQSIPRQMWASRSCHGSPISLHILFCTVPDFISACDICNNIQYMSSVCAAAEACVTRSANVSVAEMYILLLTRPHPCERYCITQLVSCCCIPCWFVL